MLARSFSCSALCRRSPSVILSHNLSNSHVFFAFAFSPCTLIVGSSRACKLAYGLQSVVAAKALALTGPCRAMSRVLMLAAKGESGSRSPMTRVAPGALMPLRQSAHPSHDMTGCVLKCWRSHYLPKQRWWVLVGCWIRVVWADSLFFSSIGDTFSLSFHRGIWVRGERTTRGSRQRQFALKQKYLQVASLSFHLPTCM